MTLPENWFGPPPELADGERWVSHHAANRTQGRRAVGGGFHVTTQRLLFSPNVIDRKLLGRAWSCVLTDVVSVGVQPRRFSLLELFSGGLVDRLRVDLRDGGRELFVVNKPEQLAARLREQLNVPEPGGDLPVARVRE